MYCMVPLFILYGLVSLLMAFLLGQLLSSLNSFYNIFLSQNFNPQPSLTQTNFNETLKNLERYCSFSKQNGLKKYDMPLCTSYITRYYYQIYFRHLHEFNNDGIKTNVRQIDKAIDTLYRIVALCILRSFRTREKCVISSNHELKTNSRRIQVGKSQKNARCCFFTASSAQKKKFQIEQKIFKNKNCSKSNKKSYKRNEKCLQ